jgi:creatinine amidohydrolase
METSIIMHLHPELVRPLEEAGDGSERKIRIEGMREGWAWAERKWSQISPDTGVGDPKFSSAAKGARFLADVSEKIGQLMYDIAQADINDLYE